MKIGILTYHWATNYGAVIQSIALQDYIMAKYPESDVFIVDFVPKSQKKAFIKCFKTRHLYKIKNNLLELNKEKKLSICRNSKMRLTCRCSTEEELQTELYKFDIIIVGSDQIWSPYFIRVSSAYYLLHIEGNFKKVAYAASFGVYDYSSVDKKIFMSAINEFDSISVRENKSIKFLENEGINSVLVPDPTLLWGRDYYLKRYDLSDMPLAYRVFILRGFTQHVTDTIEAILDTNSIEHSELEYMKDDISISKWISLIKSSKMVITNSYHCMIMCIQFHVPFYVIGEEKTFEGMNERFRTIIDNVPSLEDFLICDSNCTRTLDTFDWNTIDSQLKEFKSIGENYLSDAVVL